MPYLLLTIALLIGLYGLYRFILAANVKQVIALFLSTVLVVIAAAMFFLAVTGARFTGRLVADRDRTLDAP